MHARYYSPLQGRFLSTDLINSARLQAPQSWNKYVYARSNPMKYVDPNGQGVVAHDQMVGDLIRSTISPELRGAVSVSERGVVPVQTDATSDANLNDLRTLTELDPVVDVSTGTEAAGYPFTYETAEATFQKYGVEVDGPSFNLGLTLEAEMSESGHTTVTVSDGTGEAATAPKSELKITMAHELYGHALPEVQGRPWLHDGGGPVDENIIAIKERTKKVKE